MAAQLKKLAPVEATPITRDKPSPNLEQCHVNCSVGETCVCQFCNETDHKTHKTVPIDEEIGERKAQMGKTSGKVHKMIQERLKKFKEIKQAVELNKRHTERVVADCVQVFTALVRSIERSQAELIGVVEEKQKAAEKQAEGLIEELEHEITELQRRSTELEQLSDIEDHHHLQSSPSLCNTVPPTKNWSEIIFHTGLDAGDVRRAVSQPEETQNKEMEKFSEIKWKGMQQWAMDVTLL
ncbi:unnamed protein product [Oncorhynchus mykiss]|uniref:TRIM8/14/16/25/29/45/65 coiled-coil region domain-containing protein n=1 Tax=Oncorhynchus mykiss TaxID=8022 RepID=A0A060WQZ1_ONCMY|nr:unnamed protein product [Oncorhynchus mykiss]